MHRGDPFKLVEGRSRSFFVDAILLPALLTIPVFITGGIAHVFFGRPLLPMSWIVPIVSVVFFWIAIDEARTGSTFAKRWNRIQVVAQTPARRVVRAGLKWGLLFLPGIVLKSAELADFPLPDTLELSLSWLPTAWLVALFVNVFYAEQHGGWFDRLCGTRVTPFGVDPWQERGFEVGKARSADTTNGRGESGSVS